MAATDERAIHEFPTGTIDDNSLLIMDRPTSTPGEYETEKFAIANLGLKLLGGIDFPSNLDTEEQDIFGAINEVNAKAMNIAAEYDETVSYSKGAYCIYQNAAYCCIKDPGTTTGTFVAADWTQIKVLAEVKTNTGAINEVKSALSGLFKIDTFESGSITIAGNSCEHIATPVTVPSGYTLAGIVSFSTNNMNIGLSVCRLAISGSWAIQLFNLTSRSVTTTFEVTCLFVKSSFVA